MINAYFKHIQEQIKPILRKAKDEVVIAMAWFTNEDLFDELILCMKRHVEVSLILLDHPTNWMPYAPDFNDFIAAGGNLYVADLSIGFMHHKFCVVDNETLITGSYNWTHYAEIRNVENVVISDDTDLCRSYVEEFKRLKKVLKGVSNCKRISWEQVDEYTNVNFDEINFEVHAISEKRGLPCVNLHSIPKKESSKTVTDASVSMHKKVTTVQLVDTKKTYKANRDLGIQADEGGWIPLIEEGDMLPKVNSLEFFLDNSCPEACVCAVCEVNKEAKKAREILSKSLADIAYRSKINSKISLKIGLEVDGTMSINIKNIDNGLTIISRHHNPELVYAE